MSSKTRILSVLSSVFTGTDNKMLFMAPNLSIRKLLLVVIVAISNVQSALYLPAAPQASYELIPTNNQFILRITYPGGRTSYGTVVFMDDSVPEQGKNQFQYPQIGKSGTNYGANGGYVYEQEYGRFPPGDGIHDLCLSAKCLQTLGG